MRLGVVLSLILALAVGAYFLGGREARREAADLRHQIIIMKRVQDADLSSGVERDDTYWLRRRGSR